MKDIPVPKAKRIPFTHEEILKRTDDYQWLRDDSRKNPEIVEYLKEENAYAEAVMTDTKPLQETLFEEMKRHIKETDESTPYPSGPYFYYYRTEAGKQYPVHCRRKVKTRGEFNTAQEEIFFDENQEAAGYATYNLGDYELSHDHRLIAYASETDGSERYTIRIRSLKTGTEFPESITNTTGSMVWSANDQYLFYTVATEDTWRSWRVYRHTLGTEQKEDVVVYEDRDELFNVGLSESEDKQFIFIRSGSKETDEAWYLKSSAPLEKPICILPREPGHEYHVDHRDGQFIIMTNDDAKDFRIVVAPVDAPEKDHWQTLVSHELLKPIEGFLVRENFIAVKRRVDGFAKIFSYPKEGEPYQVPFDEAVYEVDFGPNDDFEASAVRITYQSLVTPRTDIEFDTTTRTKTVLKQKEVPGYDPEEFKTELIFADTEDGKQVPITLVLRRDALQDGPAPLLIEGYGSYGASKDPYFASTKLTLLNRGFVVAHAHIRGGGELGRTWYESGKYLNKRNTFSDFISAAEYLIKEKYAMPGKMIACGRSAGGMLMGAVANMRPDLFAGIIADVPFVDVVTTMLDETIPLTIPEFEEWGNPKNPEYFAYMHSYSPYDNVTAHPYPNMLVTAGLNDPRVQYWEPAKWVAKLRATKTDDNLLIFRTEMEQGHGGASGRYDFLKQVAFEYAFILKIVEMTDTENLVR